MSISAIFPSSAPNPSNLQNVNQQRRAEFQQLTQALQSGNLAGAQQALTALAKSASSSGLQSLQLMQDLNALGSALKSGDQTGAGQAYSSVQQILQSSNPMAAHHPHPHHGEVGSHLLTSGFPDGTGSSGNSAANLSDILPTINLTA